LYLEVMSRGCLLASPEKIGKPCVPYKCYCFSY
jgi:hypothetical protein